MLEKRGFYLKNPSPLWGVPVPGMRANVKYHKGWVRGYCNYVKLSSLRQESFVRFCPMDGDRRCRIPLRDAA